MRIDKITQDVLEFNGIDYYMFNNNDLTNIMEVIKSHVDK